jgi:hypothetical protein
MLGQFLLVAGIVEGAVLVGWRLTQLPKSQALEFLLVTPERPHGVFLAEALVGLGRFALVTLSSLPVLLLLLFNARLDFLDLPVLLLMPFTWGAVTGLGLTMWAYEPLLLRRLAEKFLLLAIFIYLAIGVVVGEKLRNWLSALPAVLSGWIEYSFTAFHHLNPFSVMQSWMDKDYSRGIPPLVVDDRMLGLEVFALVAVGLLLVRTAGRLKGHFHEQHYSPAADAGRGRRGQVGERPLAWWAVRRVTQYAGKANLWLAAGFGVLYAFYTAAGPYWPDWMGRVVFVIFDRMGGIPVIGSALIVLAAVPAAWQYGLWDSNAQDRCRRLELLLTTELKARDYWDAATAAAWRRGRGYFWVAVLLWLAALAAGLATVPQFLAALAAGMLLWTLYFSLGFRAFSRGIQANGLGTLLTLGLPALTYAMYLTGWPELGRLLPPGSVYAAVREPVNWGWLGGLVLMAAVTLVASRRGLALADTELRRWYELNHGQKAMD